MKKKTEILYALRNKNTGEFGSWGNHGFGFTKDLTYSSTSEGPGPAKSQITKMKKELVRCQKMAANYPDWKKSVVRIERALEEVEVVKIERIWNVIEIIK